MKGNWCRGSGFLLLLLLCVIGASNAIYFNCPDKTYMFFPRSATEPKCLPHPVENCIVTQADDEVTKCQQCQRGFYLDQSTEKYTCKPCESECSDCQGPGLDGCVSLIPGKRYDPSTKQIYPCNPGCALCDRSGNCISCKIGYRTQEKIQNGSPVMVNGHATVDCIPCAKRNCEFCSMTNSTLGLVETCAVCKTGYGPDKFNGHCQLCPLNCQNCFNDFRVCDFCSDNFFRSPETSTCVPNPVPNCARYDGQRRRCAWCSVGYTLEHPTGNCVSCASLDPLCSQCALGYGPVVAPAASAPIVCHSCIQGHFFDANAKKCKRCSAHCEFCSSETSCMSCYSGYSLTAGQCAALSTVGCAYAKDGKCLSCDVGYYLDQPTSTCKKCSQGCLSCIGEGIDKCMWCPVSKFTLRPNTDNTISPANKMRPDICILLPQALTCTESCKDPFPIADLLGGECIKGSAQPEPPKSKYTFTITPRTSSEPDTVVREIMKDTYTYLIELSKYDIQYRIHMEKWSNDNKALSQMWSKRCNYRGVLVERVTYEREAFFECNCMKGHLGIDCAINSEQYHSMQKHIVTLLTELESYMKSANQDNWLQAFINLNSGAHSRNTLDRLGEALSEYVLVHSKIIFQPQTFIGALDSVFRSHYRHHLQGVRDLTSKHYDLDEVEFLKTLHERVHKLIHLGRDTLRRSLAIQKDGFSISRSEAFQVSFTRPNKDQVTEGSDLKNMIAIFPPNLMGTSHVIEPVLVNVNCAAVRNNVENYFINSWAFSNLLFSKTIYDGIIISYVVAIDVNGDPFNAGVCNQNGDNLRVKFPLRVTPTDAERSKLSCLVMTFEESSSTHKYRQIEKLNFGYYAESKQPYIECDYGAFQVTSETFFTVGYRGHESHFHTGKLDRVAMDESDELPTPLKQYELPKHAFLACCITLLLGTLSILSL